MPSPQSITEAELQADWPAKGDDGLPYVGWPLSRTLIGFLAGLLLGALVLPAPIAIADPSLDTYGALIAVQAILGASFLITALVVAEEGDGIRAALARLGMRRFRPVALGWMLLAYLGYVAAVAVYAAVFGTPDQQDIARDLGLDSGTVAAVLSVLLIAGLAPVAEELFFRGMLFGGMRARLPFLTAALISAVIFGSLHLATGVSAVPPLVLFGFTLSWLYERTGSLWPAIILHAINNSLALVLSA